MSLIKNWAKLKQLFAIGMYILFGMALILAVSAYFSKRQVLRGRTVAGELRTIYGELQAYARLHEGRLPESLLPYLGEHQFTITSIDEIWYVKPGTALSSLPDALIVYPRYDLVLLRNGDVTVFGSGALLWHEVKILMSAPTPATPQDTSAPGAGPATAPQAAAPPLGEAPAGVIAELRVAPHGDLAFVARAVNHTDKPVRLEDVGEFSVNANWVEGYWLDKPKDSANLCLGMCVIHDFPTFSQFLLHPGKPYVHLVTQEVNWERPADHSGHYVSWDWFLDGVRSRKVLVGYADADGKLALPAIQSNDSGIKLLLAFIFHEKQPAELGFLVVNATATPVSLALPLGEPSPILASAPAIGYQRALTLPKTATRVATVAAGQVVEWRIPWQTVLDTIPQAEQAEIVGAGGDLDLVWQAAGFSSAVLPLCLATPGDGLKEQGLEYLGELGPPEPAPSK